MEACQMENHLFRQVNNFNLFYFLEIFILFTKLFTFLSRKWLFSLSTGLSYLNLVIFLNGWLIASYSVMLKVILIILPTRLFLTCTHLLRAHTSLWCSITSKLSLWYVGSAIVNKQTPGTNLYNSEHNFSEGITGVSCGPLSALLFTVEFSILLNTLLWIGLVKLISWISFGVTYIWLGKTLHRKKN